MICDKLSIMNSHQYNLLFTRYLMIRPLLISVALLLLLTTTLAQNDIFSQYY